MKFSNFLSALLVSANFMLAAKAYKGDGQLWQHRPSYRQRCWFCSPTFLATFYDPGVRFSYTFHQDSSPTGFKISWELVAIRIRLMNLSLPFHQPNTAAETIVPSMSASTVSFLLLPLIKNQHLLIVTRQRQIRESQSSRQMSRLWFERFRHLTNRILSFSQSRPRPYQSRLGISLISHFQSLTRNLYL